MLSPVKAITVGALVFALGGLFLIAQPFDQGGSVPGAEQGAEPMVPLEVTGKLIYSEGACTEAPERVGPVEWNIGATCEMDMEWSDPRLQGTGVQLHNGMSYSFGDDIELDIDSNVLNIVTDTGAWRMRPHVRFHFPDMSEPPGSPEWYVLDGEGAYEGLSVVLVADGPVDLRGFIIESELLPPSPEGASMR
jgi:hypothetical protein